MKVVDNRATTVTTVQDIDFGGAFMTKCGDVYIRVCCGCKVELFEDEVLVMHSSGDAVGMNKTTIVQPINVELTIVD